MRAPSMIRSSDVYADATILTPLTAGPHTLVLSAKLRGVRRDAATFHITAG
jgi:hypothetical protein